MSETATQTTCKYAWNARR